VAAMSDMPDVARNIMSLCSCHWLREKHPFCPRKTHYRPISEGKFKRILRNIKYLAWSDHNQSTNHLLDGGEGSDTLYDGDGNNTLYGGSGTDYLLGGAGVDILDGGPDDDYLYGSYGNDLYLFGRGSGQDTISEYDPTPGNMDTLRFSSDVARSDVEITRSGDDMVFKVKGTSDQVVVQYWMLDVPYRLERMEFGDGRTFGLSDLQLGTTANDVLNGTSSDTIMMGNAGNDTLNGGGGNDLINGGSGMDTLNGGTGADTLIGGLGNDTYLIDNTGDGVIEFLDEGTDTVKSYIPYTLGANLENLTLMGTSAINGAGNSLNNTLSGNSAANVLAGGLGNDTLNGGAEADTLIGGLGNDTYVIDNIGDVITEALNEGTDTVQSSITYR